MKHLIFSVLAVLSTLACSSTSSDCELAPELRQRAGASFSDCGHAALGSNAQPVDQCVVTAFNAKQPFFARYDRMGTDSQVIFGVAGDANGNVTFLTWDSDPSGGSGAGPVISASTCVAPSVDDSPGRDAFTSPPLRCESVSESGRVCG